jgi:hypothetical protein
VEQRQELRKTIAARVQVAWKDQTGAFKLVPGMLEDVSINGAAIRIATPIPRGARLEVRWRSKDFSGSVQHCRPMGTEYLLGILKDPVQEACLGATRSQTK